MLSAIPVTLPAGSMLGNSVFPSFDFDFPSWDPEQEYYSPQSDMIIFPDDDHAIMMPLLSSSPESGTAGSDQDHKPVDSTTTTFGSDGVDPMAMDERKRRRMISNRESARRSRMRKQRHLENLRNQLSRLRLENRELTNRLRFISYHCHLVRTDNDRLRSEHSMLRRKLSNIRQILMFRLAATPTWPCNNIINAAEQFPSLITS
ncbi:bZIP transcription factor 44 [Linum grandiflorum]